MDTSDAHVDLKYGALVLVSSFIEVSVAVLLDQEKKYSDQILKLFKGSLFHIQLVKKQQNRINFVRYISKTVSQNREPKATLNNIATR